VAELAPDWEPQQTVATDEKPLDHPPHWTWFYKPQRFFAGVASWLWPLRWLAYIAPITIGLGVWTLASHYHLFVDDFVIYRRPMTLFQHLVFSFFTDNIIVQMGRGIIGAACGAEILRFGIRLAVGIVPRFGTQIGSLAGLDKTRLLWVHSGPLFIRSHIFAFSSMAWFMTRESGTNLHGIFLLLTTMGGLSFFLTANPLMRTPGYHTLTTLLDIPDLRQRANRALLSSFRGGQKSEEGSFALRMYALASLIWFFCVVSFVLYLIGSWLELNYAGLGVSVFIALVLLLVLRFRNQAKKRSEKRVADRARTREARIAELRSGAGGRGAGGRGGMRGGMGGGMEGGMSGMDGSMGGRGGRMAGGMGARMAGGGAMPRGGTMARGGGPMGGGAGPRSLARLPSGTPGEVGAPEHGAVPKKKSNPFIRYGLLGLFIVVMFLPYHYEPGGPVTIFPLQQQEVHAEISGILDDVPFNGGEFVKAGTLIAKISSLEEERHVQTTRADIAKRQADLEELLSTPRPEDVQLAQQKLDTATTQAQFSREEVQRLEPVFKGGHISLEDFEQARKRASVDTQQVLEAQSELRKVKAGPHPKEIEALRYEIAGLQEQLVYYEQQLEKTSLFMPFDGRITTINLKDKLGLYLKKGDLFATVENDESLRVEFDVPEYDASEFAVGSAVRIKIWTYPDRIFTGKVTEIAPAVDTEHEEGEVLKVTTILDNKDSALVSGMTGFGKIDGGTKPVIVAFSRAIVRFFLIEVWSWLP
jgi:multidrug resistance efflux pump